MNVDTDTRRSPPTTPVALLSAFMRRAEQAAALAPAPATAPATATSTPNPATHFSSSSAPTDSAGPSSSHPSMGSGGYGGGGSYGGSSSSRPHPRPAFTPETTPVPEKCFSWCSQRAEDTPMCRMFCLRMRQPLPTQKEQIARLHGSRHDEALGARSPAEQEAAAAGIFGRMKRALAPYSIIVLKGTTEGIAGRYMEELEKDDGNYDFGHMSRNAPDKWIRNGPQGMHYHSWGSAGYMLYLPLTSLFWPIVSLPENVERVFGPPLRMIQKITNLTNEGSQAKIAKEIYDRAVDGRGLAFAKQVGEYAEQRAQKRREEEQKRRQMIEDQARQELERRADPRYRYDPRLDPYREQKVAEVKAGEEAARVAKMGKEKEEK